MLYGFFCFSVNWVILRNLVWVKLCYMESVVNFIIIICCLEVIVMDYEDDV